MKRIIIINSVLALILLISGNLMAQDTLLNKNAQSAKIANSQMKEVKVLASEDDKLVVAKAINNLEFDFDKTTIRSDSYPSLQVLADWLKARDFTLKVSGYADYIGSNDYNLMLSNKRAQAVKDYLVDKGANPLLIDPIGYGENLPADSNDTDSGRQKNRRVEFSLY